MERLNFYAEIRRNFRVLGEQGVCQAERDIKDWQKTGLITDVKAIELKEFADALYKSYKLHESNKRKEKMQ